MTTRFPFETLQQETTPAVPAAMSRRERLFELWRQDALADAARAAVQARIAAPDTVLLDAAALRRAAYASLSWRSASRKPSASRG